jgi:hypothetical protein
MEIYVRNSIKVKSVLITLLSVSSFATASIENHIPAVRCYGDLKDSQGKLFDVNVTSNPGKQVLLVSIFPSNQDGPRENQTTKYSIFEVNTTYDVLSIKGQHTNFNRNGAQRFATLNIFTDFATSSGNYNADLMIKSNSGHGFTKNIESPLTCRRDRKD